MAPTKSVDVSRQYSSYFKRIIYFNFLTETKTTACAQHKMDNCPCNILQNWLINKESLKIEGYVYEEKEKKLKISKEMKS